MKKLLALLTIFAMVMTFAACGGNKDNNEAEIKDVTAESTEETTVLALPDPAANVNPEEMDWGWNADRPEPFDNMTSDIWYVAGKDGDNSNYMYFVNGHSAYKVENGEEKSSGWILSADNHMVVDPEYSEFDFDIVFMDNFTLYDYTTNTYYTRGDQNEYGSLFVGKTFTCKTDEGRAIAFNEDGTVQYFYRGEPEPAKWEVIARRIVRVIFEDYDNKYYIFYNADGSVECISENCYNLDNAYMPG